ncbi:4Fe-4S binding protein [Ferribacterium limneticum]|uniref:4Fe-4S binding protein n=1 Tax=Ferribacterium limneticum TaxID=76259 RepID=UPI001CFA1B33|nr:4Fe-4S binding protein [Ferribacterium limneticum]UCV27334.1 4Fe-4S binding protein [Ferribacterium limneticum]UCV31251.1 4Fe-4S binding protein [Ferribacterium limneticum]
MAEQVLKFYPQKPASRLESLGLWLRRHRGAIVAVQWLIVVFYSVLVVIPAFLPLPPDQAHIWDNLRLFAQFCFWGLWWPGVMIATVTLGRVWCGLFCPEGFISERVSRYGRGKALPRWLKWPGWPFIAFVGTTVYGQLVSVYEYPQAALLVLGGSTVAAVVIGLLYGREKRIWCRYLCPASGVFAVLAKIAPMHYKVDRAAWDRHEGEFEPVNCAPLVDVRRMTSAGECHACGRCAGQRDAVSLSWRSPFSEVLDPHNEAKTADAITLLFGVLGVATAAFQWTVSPWLLHIKLAVAEWLVENDHFALLSDDVPWWLLTHYPEANDLFTWLDGSLILAYLLLGGALIGSLLLIGTASASRLLRTPQLTWQRFSIALAPMAAASVILGLTMLTVTHLKAEHFWLGWLPWFRSTLLALGWLGSVTLALLLVARSGAGKARQLAAGLIMLWPPSLICTIWVLVFFVW